MGVLYCIVQNILRGIPFVSGWETADGEDLLAALTGLLREITERFPHAHAADIIEALPGSAPDSGALLRLFSLMEYELRQ